MPISPIQRFGSGIAESFPLLHFETAHYAARSLKFLSESLEAITAVEREIAKASLAALIAYRADRFANKVKIGFLVHAFHQGLRILLSEPAKSFFVFFVFRRWRAAATSSRSLSEICTDPRETSVTDEMNGPVGARDKKTRVLPAGLRGGGVGSTDVFS